MKRFMILALVALMTVGAGSAFAKGGNGGGGNGGGRGAGDCTGMGASQSEGGFGGAGMKGQRGMGNRLPADFTPVTQEQADAAAADFISSNLNGFDVKESTTFDGKRFTGYKYTVEDAQGNTFDVIVNAKGDVRGPFAVQN